MALFAKKIAIESTIGPARTALIEHLRERKNLNDQRVALGERINAAIRDVQRAESAAAAVSLASAAADESEAIARYTGLPSTDLASLRKSHAEALAHSERMAPIGRAATVVKDKFTSDLAAIQTQLTALNALTPRLLHHAIDESMTELQPEFAAAEKTLREVHRRMFVLATAADALAKSHGLGTFVDASRYLLLKIVLPRNLEPQYADDLAKGRAIEAHANSIPLDLKALDREAEKLVNTMLTID